VRRVPGTARGVELVGWRFRRVPSDEED
jgi:hypothetical protein